MVSHSRTPARPDQLRPLNQPRPITVLLQNGRPAALLDGKRRIAIAQIQDTWRIDDEWWREPIARYYYQILLDTGALLAIYHDEITDTWYAQRY